MSSTRASSSSVLDGILIEIVNGIEDKAEAFKALANTQAGCEVKERHIKPLISSMCVRNLI